MSGDIVPPPPDSHYDIQIYNVNGKINYLLTEYNKLRFIYHIVNPPEYIAGLLQEYRMTRHQIEQLALPAICEGINENIESARLEFKPQDMVKYCVQEFCIACLALLKSEHKIVGAFAKIVIDKILKSDELLTKPGWFNWAIIYGDKTQKTQDSNLDNKQDEDGDIASFTNDDQEEADIKPFSNDGFDVEEAFVEDGEDLEIRVINDIDGE